MRTNYILALALDLRLSVTSILMVIEENPKWVATEGHPYSRGAPLWAPKRGKSINHEIKK